MEKKLFKIADICVACGEQTIEGEMLCCMCQRCFLSENPVDTANGKKRNIKAQHRKYRNMQNDK